MMGKCNKPAHTDVQRDRRIRIMSDIFDKSSKSPEGAGTDFPYLERYLAALLDGDSAAAASIIDLAIGEGISPCTLYVRLLAPAQAQLGILWHSGSISVATEHLGTQITLGQLDRLRQSFRCKPCIGLKAVVMTPDGDMHTVGARMIADFLLLEGWEVDFLGPSVPPNDLVDFVKKHKPNLVAFSITLEKWLDSLSSSLNALSSAKLKVKTLVGGSAVKNSPHLFAGINADCITSDPVEALNLLREQFGLSCSSTNLDEFLKRIGSRVQSLRHQRDMSQGQLAEIAGLDRTYISAVEHGKQNVSIGVIMKLASALNVTIESLLLDDLLVSNVEKK